MIVISTHILGTGIRQNGTLEADFLQLLIAMAKVAVPNRIDLITRFFWQTLAVVRKNDAGSLGVPI